MSSRPHWKQHAAATVAKAETPHQVRQLLRLHLHNMNSRDLEESAVWGARAVLTRIRTPGQLETAVRDVLGELRAATAHGATLRLELATFSMDCFGYIPLAGCLPWVMKQVARECGGHKLDSTGAALVGLAGAVARAVLRHLRINRDGGEEVDDDGVVGGDIEVEVQELRGSESWMSGLLVEPLLRALSSGPHALRMAHAAAALGAVLAEAQAGEGVPAVVAMAQRCLAALLCMGKLCAEAFEPLTICINTLGPTNLTASSLRHAVGLCLKAGSHSEWRVRLASVETLHTVAEHLHTPLQSQTDDQRRDVGNALIAEVLRQHRRKAIQALTNLKYDKIGSVRNAAKETLQAWERVPAGKDEPSLVSVPGKENSGQQRPQRGVDSGRAASRPVWRPVALVRQPASPSKRRAQMRQQEEGVSHRGVPRREYGLRRPGRCLPDEQRDFGIVILEGPRPPARTHTAEVDSTAAPPQETPSPEGGHKPDAIALGADLSEYSPPVEMPEGQYHHGKGSFRREESAGRGTASEKPESREVLGPPVSVSREEAPADRPGDRAPPAPQLLPRPTAALHGEPVALQRVCAWVDGVSVAAGQTLGLGIQITAPPSPSLSPPRADGHSGSYPSLLPTSPVRGTTHVAPSRYLGAEAGSPGVTVSVKTVKSPDGEDEKHYYQGEHHFDEQHRPLSTHKKLSLEEATHPAVVPHPFSFNSPSSPRNGGRGVDAPPAVQTKREGSSRARASASKETGRGRHQRGETVGEGAAPPSADESQVTDEEARLMGEWGFGGGRVALSSEGGRGADDSIGEVESWFDGRSPSSSSPSPQRRVVSDAGDIGSFLHPPYRSVGRQRSASSASFAEDVSSAFPEANDGMAGRAADLFTAQAHVTDKSEVLPAHGIDAARTAAGGRVSATSPGIEVVDEADWRPQQAASSHHHRRRDAVELFSAERAARTSFLVAAEEAERAAAAVFVSTATDSTSSPRWSPGAGHHETYRYLTFAEAIQAADTAFHSFRHHDSYADDQHSAETSPRVNSSPNSPTPAPSFADAVAAADKACVSMHRRYRSPKAPQSPSPASNNENVATPVSNPPPPASAVPSSDESRPAIPPSSMRGREFSPSSGAVALEMLHQAVNDSAGLTQQVLRQRRSRSPTSLSLADAASKHNPDRRNCVFLAEGGGSPGTPPASLKDGSGVDFKVSRSESLVNLLGISAAEQTPKSGGENTPIVKKAVDEVTSLRLEGSPAMTLASGGPLEASEARSYQMRRHMADAIVDISRFRLPEESTTPRQSPERSATTSQQINVGDSPRSRTAHYSLPTRSDVLPRRSAESHLSGRCDALIEAAGFSPPLEGQALQKALQRILQLETEALKTQYRAAHKEQLSDIRNNSSLSAAEVAEHEALILRATESALQSEIQEFIEELLPKLATKLVGTPNNGRL